MCLQHSTMESLLERGEKIDDLVSKSEVLGIHSKAFYKTVRTSSPPLHPASASQLSGSCGEGRGAVPTASRLPTGGQRPLQVLILGFTLVPAACPPVMLALSQGSDALACVPVQTVVTEETWSVHTPFLSCVPWREGAGGVGASGQKARAQVTAREPALFSEETPPGLAAIPT